MDDSEQEREYDYDIDDAEEDPHNDFDDLPEEDDDDDDDDDLEHYIRSVGHPDIYFAQPTAIEIPLLNRPDPFLHALPLRPRHSSNGFHLDNIIPVDPPVVSIPHLRDESVRSAFLDSFEPGNPHYNRLLEQMDSFRMEPHPNQMAARVRSAALPIIAPRWQRSSEHSSGIHPLLHPPRRAVSSSSLSLSVLSSLARRGTIPSAVIDRSPTTMTSALGPHVRAMDAIVRVAPPPAAPSSSADVPSSSSDPPPRRRPPPPPLVPRPDHTTSSIPRARDGQPLTHLLSANLMRSVAIPPRSEEPLAAFTRSRAHHDRAASRDRDRDRERDREKVPSHIVNRWSYDPPLSGGDSLPPIFDADAGNRSSRSSPRHGGVQSFVTSEPSKPMQKSASKICSRIMSMLTAQRAVDEIVTAEGKKLELKKKIEEEGKKKAEGGDKTEKAHSSNESETKQKTSDESDDRSDDAKPKMSDYADVVGEISGGQSSSAAEASSSGNAATTPAGGNTVDDEVIADAGDIVVNNREVDGEVEITTDSVPDGAAAAEDERVDTEMEAPEMTESPTEEAAPPLAEEPAANETGATSSGIVFSAVATERAAAAGISLDAPANENPEVIAAATQSTGIDPAFLAALPEDMRTEILTRHYEQIRTNTEGQGGTSSPVSTNVNQDFLMALPPVLRAEVLELEAEFQSRQEGQNAPSTENTGASAANAPSNVAAAEMDNATFLATLAPDLREEILLTSGEAFIESLPPNVAAEARVLREREMSRVPWRMGRGEPSLGAEARAFASAMRGSGPGGRRDGRVHPREAPLYRWKKAENGWLRKRPNVEDEPDSYMKPDGLSALVDMLWYRHPSIDDNMIYQVFSYVCKTTESRYVVLDELVQLITSNASADEQKPKSPSCFGNEDRARYHGTAVLRGLKVLTMLCKNDAVVAETLLGLPKTDEELKSLGTTTEVNIADDEGNADSSLSTLVSLLSSPLFTRSSSHLGLLVTLISAVAHSIPSSEVNPVATSRSRRTAGRHRSFLDRPSLSHLADPLNILMPGTDEDDPGIFDLRDEENDEDIDSDDPFEIPPPQTVPAAESPDENSNSEAKEKEKKAEEVRVPVEFRVPVLRKCELIALAKVLLRAGCSERTYEKTSRSIGLLGEHPSNRDVFVVSLISIATDSGREIEKEYNRCISMVVQQGVQKTPKDKTVFESSFFMASAANELTLLRVVKSLSTLLRHNASHANVDNMEAKEDDAMEAKEQRSWQSEFKECMLHGLRDLWNSLDKLLELVSEEVKLKEKKESKELRPSRVASSVLNPDRMKPSGRSLSPTLARLSPMIEAFLVTHAAEDDNNSCRDSSKIVPSPVESGGASCSASPKRMDSANKRRDLLQGERGLDEQLALFVERHRDPINALLRANPSLLETSFKGALRHPHAIDFDNKKAYFRNVIRRRSSEAHAGTIRISVRRDRVFDDSYHQLRMRSPEHLKGRLHVQFTGEEGVDAGGVTREWYTILARQIFDPNYVLFTRSAAKSATYQPDKRSYINREHLENFRFVGRIIGKAIYDGQLLDAYFTRSFYKHILGLKPTYHDIEAQDPEYYKSLKWMLENNIDGILDYTMSAEYDEFGKQTIVDLMPDGRNIPVVEENKADYVRLVTEVRMTKTIEKQIEAFKEGFYELIPYDDCKIFNELELELLMSGLPDIDVSDLKANVEYTGYTASSPQINWFWRCVSKMDQEDLARLVMFVTGTSKVPLEGFSQLQGMNGVQKFQIHRVGGNTMRLPSAHTCFNQLDLPEYSTAEILSERLMRAVRECSVGFGFA